MVRKVDLIGQTFDRLTVICEVPQIYTGRVRWKCLCSCGKVKEVDGRLLRNGAVRSCGCLINADKKQPMVGLRFGRLTVIEEHPVRALDGHVIWLCLCDCEATTLVAGHSLRAGDTNSCGCLCKEETGDRFRLHGGSGDPEYLSWLSMKRRCLYKKDKDYHRYGGREISICAPWLSSFEQFKADMGIRPLGTSLDRINNEGNYTPENCKWSTPKEQANNRRARTETLPDFSTLICPKEKQL
jgi:hypothetical protein